MIITQYIPKHKLGKLETSHCVEKTLPPLLSRTGDSSSRLRLLASTFIQVGVSLQIRELIGEKHLIRVDCETRVGCCGVLQLMTESYHNLSHMGLEGPSGDIQSNLLLNQGHLELSRGTCCC